MRLWWRDGIIAITRRVPPWKKEERWNGKKGEADKSCLHGQKGNHDLTGRTNGTTQREDGTRRAECE